MMNKIILSSVACAALSLPLHAQSFQYNGQRMVTHAQHAALTLQQSKMAKRQLQAMPLNAVKALNGVSTSKSVSFNEAAARAVTRAVDGHPGAFYTVNKGAYQLVPNYVIVPDDENPVFADRGFLGMIDGWITCTNATPLCDSYTWEWNGDTYANDPVFTTRVYNSDAGYVSTPKLTATIGKVDSTYQAGTYIDAVGKVVEGMISTSGIGWIYNVDVDAEPYANTFFVPTNNNDVWNNLLFGYDPITKANYVEYFTKPCSGYIALLGTEFQIAAPKNSNVATKTFTMTYAEVTDGKSDARATMTAQPQLYYEGTSYDLYQLYFTPEDGYVMISNDFYNFIQGPQDGTQWALLCQTDRAMFTDAERNTAYVVPTVGEDANKMINYVFQTSDGKDHNFNTSLDIHNHVITPYIIVADAETQNCVTADTICFANGGETKSYLLMDWYGGSTQTTMRATITEQTSMWLSLEQAPKTSEADEYLFATSLKAKAKPITVGYRSAVVNFVDETGVTKRLFCYQGELPNAIHDVKATDVKVSSSNGAFELTYAAGYHTAKVYNMLGQVVMEQTLNAQGGVATLNASQLATGLYTVQFCGASTKSVKILK